MSKPHSRAPKKACPFAEFIERRAEEASKKAADKMREKLSPRATLSAAMYASIVAIRDKEVGKHSVQSEDAQHKLKQKIWDAAGKFYDDAGHKKADEE